MYKSGYDPNGMVDIFEKIDALSGAQPGKVSQLFRSHPATGDRIVKVQKEIQTLLKTQPQYVVTTSEFNNVQARLRMILDRRKSDAPDPNRPTLKRAPDRKLAESVKSRGDGQRPTL